jgi:carbon monoxide dehydrogenase subunit G
MPGARLTKPIAGGRAEGEVNVKLGPIVSAFQGILEVTRDDDNFRGVVRGAGRDTKGPSSARAIITYDVRALEAARSQVDVSVRFLLSGALAQFSRSGLVKDVADHLTHVFAQNLEAGCPAGRPRLRPTHWMSGRWRGRRFDSHPRLSARYSAVRFEWRPNRCRNRCPGIEHRVANSRAGNTGTRSSILGEIIATAL